MKYKNYLVRLSNGKFALGRGYDLEKELAYVRIYKEGLIPSKKYSIIDRETGLNVISGDSISDLKDKCKRRWNCDVFEGDFSKALENALYNARSVKKYYERVIELREEKETWKESGYVFEA